MKVFIGFLIPFLGTSLGAAMVFFMKKALYNNARQILSGVAAGVMCAASVWSLIIPSLESESSGKYISLLICILGFLSGVFVLIFTQKLSNKIESIETYSKNSMLIFAVTLHNIPEGMAIGVSFANFLSNKSQASLAAAIALCIGIAIQNFPEGAIISMPLRSEGKSKIHAFLLGVLSGAVEPVAAVLTLLLTTSIIRILPFLLSFPAGAMIFVSVDELIPESRSEKSINIGAIGFITGFLTMMALDVAFG